MLIVGSSCKHHGVKKLIRDETDCLGTMRNRMAITWLTQTGIRSLTFMLRLLLSRSVTFAIELMWVGWLQ